MKGYAVLDTTDEFVTTGTGIRYIAVFLNKQDAQRWLRGHGYANFAVVEVTLSFEK
jgi:hypothetical protein